MKKKITPPGGIDIAPAIARAVLNADNDDDLRSVLITDPKLRAELDQAEAERSKLIAKYRRGEISEEEEIAALDLIGKRMSICLKSQNAASKKEGE